MLNFSNVQLQQQIHFLHNAFFIHGAIIGNATPFFEQLSKQNKSLLLVNNNCGCLILLVQKKPSQVAWFDSTSIFQRLNFYSVP